DYRDGINLNTAAKNALQSAPLGVPWDQYAAGLVGSRAWFRSHPLRSQVAGFTTSFAVNSSIQGGMSVYGFLSADANQKRALAEEGITDVYSAFANGVQHSFAMNFMIAMGG